MKNIKTCKNLKGKNVLVRVDFNVPIKNKKILDNNKIKASLETINFLIKEKAKVLLITHIGRPDGKIVTSLKVDPVISELSKLLNKKVIKIDSKNWNLSDKKKTDILKQLEKIKSGSVAMLENIRFSKEEDDEDSILAKELANLGDIFVLDGFSVAHRKSASVTGLSKLLDSYAGFLLEKEVKGLKKIIFDFKLPYTAVLGGIKMETKIPVINSLLKKTDFILIGGGIFNTYLKSLGYKIGDSVYDQKFTKEIKKICQNKKIIKPVDVIVADKSLKKYFVVKINKNKKICKAGEKILDIGPESILLFSKYIKKSNTLVWNGAMGLFEKKPFDVGTKSVARLFASRAKGRAFGVVGGGETLQVINELNLNSEIDLVSTGGGAMLEYIANEKLPGIENL